MKNENGTTRWHNKVVNSERGKWTVLRPPIQHLIPLELHIEPDTRSDVGDRDNCDHVVKIKDVVRDERLQSRVIF